MAAINRIGHWASVILLTVSLAACGGGTNPNNASSKPEDSAKSMIDALFSGKDITPLLCTAAQSQASAIKTSLSRLAAADAKVDTSALTYTASNVSGDAATVSISGNLKVATGNTSTDVPFPGIKLPMKNENGWKVCS